VLRQVGFALRARLTGSIPAFGPSPRSLVSVNVVLSRG
jgi:hypothetical protein